MEANGLHELTCVIHVHSDYSDGTATVDEILGAARAAGAGALLLTDHDTLGARRDGRSGWHDGVLLIVGHEVSPRGGHFLAFGLDSEIPHDGRSEREIAAAVHAAGGLGFPAHPFSEGSAISARIGRPHGWRDLAGAPIDGIEVWSLLTDAAERCATVRELLALLRRPEHAIDHPPARALEAWDRLGRERRLPGFGGLDAHQSGFRRGGRILTPFPNERIFATLRTHVLLERPLSGEWPADEQLVLGAIAAGRCFLAVDSLAPADGFRFHAEGGDGRVEMGEERPFSPCVLRAELPADARVRLLRDGEPVAEARGRSVEHRAEAPGVYRVSAEREQGGRERTWILSNPVYLRASPGRLGR